MHRRTFIKNLAVLPVLGSGMLLRDPASINSATGATGNRTVVALFQRGGCDGLNTVVPYGDRDYARQRPTIAIPPPGNSSQSAIALDGFFGLHPALQPLESIYRAGRMAVLPTVGYPNADRSHFIGQALIESGTTSKNQPNGWLNRYLATRSGGSPICGIAFGTGVPFSLAGNASVAAVNNLGSGLVPVDDRDAFLRRIMGGVLGQSRGSQSLLQSISGAGRTGLDALDALAGLDPDRYSPSNGARYPSGGFGTALRNIAQVIKARRGLEVATVDIGGWDLHNRQGGGEPDGSQSQLLRLFAEGIAAFYTDLGSLQDDVVVLSMSEFGRTIKENASGGTDHGNAFVSLAVGGNVRGGIYGEWPGLNEGQQYLGRYLPHTVDIRDVMGEVVSRHLGASNLGSIFPDHSYRSIGYL